MAEKKYLDYTGFSYFVGKIKALLTNKADKNLSNVESSVLAEKVTASGAGGTPIVTTAGDGSAYTATAPNIKELSVGLTVTIIPHTVSTSTTPTLNLNSLGAKQIRRRLSNMATSQEAGYSASWLASGKPFTVKYDGTYWIVEDMTKPTAADLYGTLAISKGGTGANNATDARVNLGIETRGGTVTSQNADYAEIGEWADGNTSDEDRIGYFVAVDTASAGTTMVKATSTADVRGVTVTAPAFSGNCSADKFGTDGTLLKQYDYVAVMGLVSVIDNGTCTVNGRCMPNDNGTAVPSSNNMGYQVIDRIDSTHILIAVEPGADMIKRIKDVISGLGSKSTSVTLDTSGWAVSGDRYYQTVAVADVAADTPVVVVDCALDGTDLDADAAVLEAWQIVSCHNVTQGDGTLTFYSYDIPTVNIPVNVGVA